MTFSPSRLTAGGSRGVALIVTLMMMAVLVMMVVGLAGVMRNEQAAARNLTYQVLADQLAEIGARQAMALVLSNSQYPDGFTNSPTVTGPGWLTMGGQTIPLFPQQAANFGVKNVEEVGTNSLVLSLPATGRGTLLGAWTNLAQTGTTNPFGRYTFWVDDEGGKINLNFVGGTNNKIFSLLTNFPLAAQYANSLAEANFLFVSNFLTGARAGSDSIRARSLASRTNSFFSTESLKDTNVLTDLGTNQVGGSVYRRTKGQVTAWSSNANLNPWGQPKVSLTNLRNASIVTNAADLNNFLNQTFAHPGLTAMYGGRSNLLLKYGGGNSNLGRMVIRQVLANAYEALQPASATNLTPILSSATGSNIPSEFLAASARSVMLNEVAVAAALNTDTAANRLQIQIWVVPELVTGGANVDIPFENTVTSFAMANNGIRVVSATAGGKSIGPFGGFYTFTGIINAPARRTGTIASNVFYTNRTWACYEYTWGPGRGTGPADLLNNAGRTTALTLDVDIPLIVVQQRFGGATLSVDWWQRVQTVRFSFPGNMVASTAVPNPSFSASDPSGAGVNLPAGLGANNFQSVSKTDPRVRDFAGWSNAVQTWTNLTPASPGAENSTVALGSNSFALPKDVLPAPVSALRDGKVWSLPTNAFWMNTNTNTSWMARGTNFPSVASLGYIHTGLPWRTLKFSAQGADPSPPDWILADLLTASPSGMNFVPGINLNNQIWSMTNTSSQWVARGTTNRVPTALALLASLSSAPTNGGYSNRWAATNFGRGWTNLLNVTDSNRWIANSFWSRFRSMGSGSYTNPGVFLFSGELAEIDGVGNVGTTDEEREAALMAAGDLVSTRSDTFSVWSVGQALVVLTNPAGLAIRTNVMAEVRKQTVFQRFPGTNPNGTWQINPQDKVTNWTVKVLYTRNHVVE